MKPEDLTDTSAAQQFDQDASYQESLSGPGALLKRAREQQGLTQNDVASKIYVKPATVEALEQDKIDGTMSVTFTKGYVRNYAKLLGLDHVMIIEEFDRIHSTPKSSAQLQSFSQRVAKQAHDDRWMMVTWVILFLIIAGVVAWWYQQDDSAADDEDTVIVQQASERGAAQDTQDVAEDAMRIARNAASGAAQKAAETVSNVTGNDTAQNNDATTTSVQTDSAVTEAPSEASEQSQSGSSPVAMAFTFGEDCWVSITDSTGEQLAHGTKRAGRTMQVTGQPPIKVTLGAPDQVAVTYAGQTVDISKYQNGRTARFTLPMQE
ncbi:RodZ domain-containing protein [Salinimonas lutimaris]|uniref:RodZ domain-containing protein n=1 Tax=Salinimonas lutimaris TaxID=914153 RepID=UPI0010BF6C49|nr:RodZ domain-containing protein [Salinimonas lutimaris]